MDGPWLPLFAVLAGVLSFSSPCTLPLVPGYLGYLAGVGSGRGRTLGAAALFVTGFALVFTALGAGASTLGSLLLEHRLLLEKVAGVVIVLLGLFVFGLVRMPLLMREGRPLMERVRPGPAGAVLLGAGFALGWTPCIGPVLGAILVLAGAQGTANAGALLLLLYSLGLGVPFLAAALLLDRFHPVSAWLRRHTSAINAAGGSLLVAMGTLVFLGQLVPLLAPALELYARLRWPPL
ncbi:MAG TPA: cytochrome c biogenesis protein CcdA [Candidatus Dormibacteraeota bacterium]|nr:cytochrome c biogenesis protein CcdA [Candidatus Dormibacteraeota bacterium]